MKLGYEEVHESIVQARLKRYERVIKRKKTDVCLSTYVGDEEVNDHENPPMNEDEAETNDDESVLRIVLPCKPKSVPLAWDWT